MTRHITATAAIALTALAVTVAVTPVQVPTPTPSIEQIATEYADAFNALKTGAKP